ncbi:SH3 domain-containing protein [Arthrobacter rhombi]|uniref:SH3 domain-containing protein n=1 Tax=Arthrobacter rhombi TaxID=71253 RepID=UPI0031E09058
MKLDHPARRIVAAVALAVALAAGSVGGPAADMAVASTAKQTSANLNLRTSASTSSRLVTTLKKGTKVSVSSTRGSWSRVSAGKKTGWVASRYLVKPASVTKKPTPTKKAASKAPTKRPIDKVTTANLNLRSGASSKHKVVKVLKKGTTVSITSTQGTWSKGSASGKIGWLSSKYLKNPPKPVAKKPAPVKKPVAKVATTNVNLRSGASTKYKVITQVKKGANVSVTSTQGTWSQGKTGGKTGWLPSKYLATPPKSAPAPKPTPSKPTPSPAQPAAPVTFTTTSNLNLRASAPAGSVLATIPTGDTVTKTGSTAQSGTWVQVKYGSMTGWVSASYLKAAAKPGSTRVPASFAVSGAGWGHGVGMSQYGAQGQALEGRSSSAILNHYYAPATMSYTTSRAASDIRVQILSTSSSSITAANGSLRLLDGSKILATTTGTVGLTVKSGKVNAKVESKSFTPAGKLTVQWQNTRFWGSGSNATTVAVPRANDGYGTVNYRHGKLEVGILSGKLNLVNVVRLNDEYLYGLAEMPSSWQPAALQAQAVAGRTYAMRNMSSLKKNCDCNVYDEVASQKFTAWNKENEGADAYYGKRWKAAVDATTRRTAAGTPVSGAVLLYSGSLIDAVYSSSTGGMTRSSATVWGSNHAYLQSRDDHWSLLASSGNPNRSWANTASQVQVAKAFGASNVTAVKIAKNSDLTIKSATASTLSGAVHTISGSKFRSGIATKSSWVTSVIGR